MTAKSSPASPSEPANEGNDQAPPKFEYGHGRMPGFMKVVWLVFLAFIGWYVAVNLLPALGTELGG